MPYNQLSSEDIVLSSEPVTTPIWSGEGAGTATMTTFTTSSVQEMGLSGDYYLDIYQSPSSPTVEFACTFANKEGKGAFPYNAAVPENTPTRTIFGQYRSLVLGDEESDFYFGGNEGANSVSSSFFWAINIDRARYKESLMPGTLVLALSGSSSDLVLVDDSTIQGNTRYLDSGRVYNVVEGKIATNSSPSVPVYYPDPEKPASYGYFLPDIGVILLDGLSLINKGVIVDPTFWSGGQISSNATMSTCIMALIQRIKSFTLQAKETVTSNYIFIRAKNSEFNYSMNPSNITSTGELRYRVMVNSPETYITSIGLYNSNNDLVAVAKLSRPLPKNFTKEALFRIKLDY